MPTVFVVIVWLSIIPIPHVEGIYDNLDDAIHIANTYSNMPFKAIYVNEVPINNPNVSVYDDIYRKYERSLH